MNRYKVLFLVAAGACTVVLAPVVVQAQPGGGRGFRGGFGGPFGGGGVLGLVMREEVQQELQLVDEQLEKVQAAAEEMRGRMQSELGDLFAQMRDLSDEERQERFDEIRSRVEKLNADMEKQLKKVLLPHQFDRLKQIELQTRVQQRGAEALTTGELAEALNLTDQQREKLERRAEEVQQELQEQIRQLQIEARNKIFEVLTAEQRAKLDALLGDQFDLPPGPGFGRGGRGGGFGRGFGGRDRNGDQRGGR
jgi:Spy/CpxP family protein refolding chaperone